MSLAGIEAISWASAHHVYALSDLASLRGQPLGKYHEGLGQECFSFCGIDEDIVTMGAEAAAPLVAHLRKSDPSLSSLRTLLFATESSIDQSKAAALWIHRLLALSPRCRSLELKQACYSATASLRLAASHVMAYPQEKVLIIAADEALYDLYGPAEPTQGAAAVALLISMKPTIATLSPRSGLHSEEVSDFWRPNHCSTPLVDGKFSTKCYLRCLEQCARDFLSQEGVRGDAGQVQSKNRGKNCGDRSEVKELFDAFCFHTPFGKMALKAFSHLQSFTYNASSRLASDATKESLSASLNYGRLVGNCYSASLWLALISLLEGQMERGAPLAAGSNIGLFSYGSGCCGELLSLSLLPHYQEHLSPQKSRAHLAQRRRLDQERYEALHQHKTQSLSRSLGHIAPPGDLELLKRLKSATFKPFTFEGTEGQRRLYASHQEGREHEA